MVARPARRLQVPGSPPPGGAARAGVRDGGVSPGPGRGRGEPTDRVGQAVAGGSPCGRGGPLPVGGKPALGANRLQQPSVGYLHRLAHRVRRRCSRPRGGGAGCHRTARRGGLRLGTDNPAGASSCTAPSSDLRWRIMRWPHPPGAAPRTERVTRTLRAQRRQGRLVVADHPRRGLDDGCSTRGRGAGRAPAGRLRDRAGLSGRSPRAGPAGGDPAPRDLATQQAAARGEGCWSALHRGVRAGRVRRAGAAHAEDVIGAAHTATRSAPSGCWPRVVPVVNENEPWHRRDPLRDNDGSRLSPLCARPARAALDVERSMTATPPSGPHRRRGASGDLDGWWARRRRVGTGACTPRSTRRHRHLVHRWCYRPPTPSVLRAPVGTFSTHSGGRASVLWLARLHPARRWFSTTARSERVRGMSLLPAGSPPPGDFVAATGGLMDKAVSRCPWGCNLMRRSSRAARRDRSWPGLGKAMSGGRAPRRLACCGNLRPARPNETATTRGRVSAPVRGGGRLTDGPASSGTWSSPWRRRCDRGTYGGLDGSRQRPFCLCRTPRTGEVRTGRPASRTPRHSRCGCGASTGPRGLPPWSVTASSVHRPTSSTGPTEATRRGHSVGIVRSERPRLTHDRVHAMATETTDSRACSLRRGPRRRSSWPACTAGKDAALR